MILNYSTLAPTLPPPLYLLIRPCLTRFHCYNFDPTPLPLSLEAQLCSFSASRITPIPGVSPVFRASGVKNWLFYRFPGRPPGTAPQWPLSSVPAPSWDHKAFLCPYILQLPLHPFSCALLIMSRLLGPSGLSSFHFRPYFPADHRACPLG